MKRVKPGRRLRPGGPCPVSAAADTTPGGAAEGEAPAARWCFGSA